MSKKVSRSELAVMLKVSAPRISQLEADGVIPAPKDGCYDPLASTLGYLAYVRRDEDGKASRAELRRMQAARIERRLRAELKQLVAPAELDMVIGDAWLLARQTHVGWLSEIFYALRARIGEPETNAILGPLHSGQLAYENALQRALKELLDTVVNGHCAADTRISDLLSSFIGDAGREPQAQGVELVADDPDAAEIITRHLGDIRAEGDRYVAGLAAARQKSGQIGGAPHAE